MSTLLKVEDLKTQFKTESGVVKAVDGISFHIDEQEIVGIVGESGCGKSVSQLSVMQLVSAPGEIVGGKVITGGVRSGAEAVVKPTSLLNVGPFPFPSDEPTLK